MSSAQGHTNINTVHTTIDISVLLGEINRIADDSFLNGVKQGYDKGKADAIADCVLENGEYCWQECCETEHCKECKWLGNGDTIWFE